MKSPSKSHENPIQSIPWPKSPTQNPMKPLKSCEKSPFFVVFIQEKLRGFQAAAARARRASPASPDAGPSPGVTKAWGDGVFTRRKW